MIPQVLFFAFLFWIAMGLGTSIPARPQKAGASRKAAEAVIDSLVFSDLD